MTLLNGIGTLTGLRLDMVGQMSYGFHLTELIYCLTPHRSALVNFLLQPVSHIGHVAILQHKIDISVVAI